MKHAYMWCVRTDRNSIGVYSDLIYRNVVLISSTRWPPSSHTTYMYNNDLAIAVCPGKSTYIHIHKTYVYVAAWMTIPHHSYALDH